MRRPEAHPFPQPPAWRSYAVAVIAAIGAVALRLAMDRPLGGNYPLLFAFAAVAVAAAHGGWRPGVFAAALNFAAADWLFVAPRHSFAFLRYDDALVALGGFSLTAGIIIFLAEGMRRERRQAMDKAVDLKTERERLRVTLASIGDAVIATDSSGRVTFVNPVAERLTGWSGEEARGKTLRDVFEIVNESTRETVGNPVQKVLTDGRIVGLANHTVLIAKDRSECAIADSAAPIRNGRGNIEGVVLVFRDVSEERAAEQELLRRSERSQLLAQTLARLLAAQDPDDIVRDLCPKVAAHIGADIFLNFMVAYDGSALRLHSSSGLDEEAVGSLQRLEFGQAICGAVAQTRKPIIAEDIQRSDYQRAALVRKLGVQAYACNPLISGDRLLGTLSFASRERSRFDAAELEFVQTISHYVALAIGRLESERELRLRERRLAEQSRLLDLSNDAIIVCDMEDRIRYWNRGAEEIYGWRKDEAVGRIKHELLHSEFPQPREQVRSILEREGRWQGELIHTRQDGERIVVSTRWALDRDAQGHPLAVLKSDNDITARKEAENALRRSEEQLAHAARVAGFGVFDHDHLTGVIYCSPRLREMHEVAPGEEPTLEALFQQLHPDDRERYIEALRQSHRPAGDGFFAIEYRIVLRNGGVRWISGRVQTLFDGDGAARRPVRSIGAELDITERKQSEEALRSSEQRLRLITDHIPALVSYVDSQFVYRFVNAEYYEWFGQPSRDVVGRSIQEVLGDQLFEKRREHIEAVMQGRETRFEAVTLHRARGPRHTEIVYVPEVDGRGRVTGFYVFVRDITERRDAQRALEEQARALREADRRKDEFLAMLAHELRNPLASVSNAAALLKASDEEDTRAWAAEVIQRQSAQLAHLIDDLLDVSRITSGKIRLRKRLVDIRQIVRAAAESVKPLIAERNHRLVFDPEAQTKPLSAEADPTRIEQVISNLLTNAAKYTENGGTIWLNIVREETTSGGCEVVIRVRDTGVGIPPERIPEMFELFTQGERSIARSEGGLGIGLTIVRKLVEMHGGTVSGRSDGEGKGSEFTVRLPAASASAKPEGRAEEGGPEPRLPAGSNGAHALVVDDNADTAVGLSRLLKLWGYQAVIAHDGESAIQLALTHCPEFILLDIGLPGMDGYEVCRRLRRERCGAQAAIIAISGYGQEEDRQRSREAGFDQHLVKPADVGELRRLLDARRGRSSMQRNA